MTLKDLQVAVNNVRTTTTIPYANKKVKKIVQLLLSQGCISCSDSSQSHISLSKRDKLDVLHFNNLSNHFVKAKDWASERKHFVDLNHGDLIVSTSSGIMTATQAIEQNKGGLLLGYYRLKPTSL